MQGKTHQTQQPRSPDASGEITFIENKEQAHIAQLVKTHPTMPEEMALDKERRKHMAELMLEYQTRTNKKDTGAHAAGAETQRYYTFQHCEKAYTTIMGKTRHIEHKPECTRVTQAENWKQIPRLQQKLQKPE